MSEIRPYEDRAYSLRSQIKIGQDSFQTQLDAIMGCYDALAEAWQKLSPSLAALAEAWEGTGGTEFVDACNCVTANYLSSWQNLYILHAQASFAYNVLLELDTEDYWYSYP